MADKLQVLFIARKFPPSVGGMERFAKDLSDSLEHKVSVYKITWGGSNTWLPLILPIFTLRAIYTLIAHRDIDIIHMQDAVQAPVGWLLHVIFHKPYIVVAHGLDITYKNKFYQMVILPFVRRADMVISISTATRQEAEARGVDSSRSQVITLGTHDDYGFPKSDKKTLADKIGYSLEGKKLLLTTGRLVKRKGVAWFVKNVLPAVVDKDSSVVYVVAGEGTEKAIIEAATEDSGMQRNVVLLGRVSDEVRSLLYQTCDVFVMPNVIVPGDMEGFGIVVHEAATAGLPVVASNLEGIADALSDRNNGFLVPTRNADAFIKIINQLLADVAMSKAFGKKARDYTLNNFSWDKIADKYVAVYKKLK